MKQLRGISFTPDGTIEDKVKYRKRIKENFSMDELKDLYKLSMNNHYKNNNEKVDVINYMMRDKGFFELGSGTNRYSMLKDGYVYKFSLDHFGFDDNWVEFRMSPTLQPFVSKTYECNGLIAVAEYVNLIDLTTFRANKDVIANILEVLAQKYLFEDLGLIDKNFRNWGFNDKGELVILDYGYIFERDDLLMRCTHCGSRIGYNNTYSQMVCTKCGAKYNIYDIKKMMEASDTERAEMFAKKEKVTVRFAPGTTFEEEDLGSGMKITIPKKAKKEEFDARIYV